MSIDEIIRSCTVRLSTNSEPSVVLGSGVLLRQEKLHDKMYLLTATHCVEERSTHALRSSIRVEIYNPEKDSYDMIVVDELEQKTICLKEGKQDIAAILLDAPCVLSVSPELPSIPIVQCHAKLSEYQCAGFPIGNNNEYDKFIAVKINEDASIHRLTFETQSSYTDSAAEGFSGGGIFGVTRGGVLLDALMTNYRMKDDGGMLFGADFYQLNEALSRAHKPQLHISYAVCQDITEDSLNEQLEETYKNLGKRFLPTFNVDADVQEKLEAVSRTRKFYEKLETEIDKWINEEPYLDEKKGEAYKRIIALQGDVLKYARGIRDYAKIDFTPYLDEANAILDILEKEDASLMLAYQEADVTRKQGLSQTREELFRLRRYCNSLSYICNVCDVDLSNNNFLIIHGEAGCGKSHLLGYFSKETKDSEHPCPAILMLGSNFASDKTIEENIKSQLRTDCSLDDLIAGLEMLGKSCGRRVPIMIDALNETKDMTYWQETLPGFVKYITRHPYIALIVSVRDTFMSDVISDTYYTVWRDRMQEHKGFEEGEFEAVRQFCIYYDLEPLKVPTLNPEFSNPLYLHIACQIAKESGERSLPVGWGIDMLFGEYVKKLDREFEKLHNREYKNKHIVTKSVDIIANRMCELSQTYLSYDECDAILKKAYPEYPFLLNDLLE